MSSPVDSPGLPLLDALFVDPSGLHLLDTWFHGLKCCVVSIVMGEKLHSVHRLVWYRCLHRLCYCGRTHARLRGVSHEASRLQGASCDLPREALRARVTSHFIIFYYYFFLLIVSLSFFINLLLFFFLINFFTFSFYYYYLLFPFSP